MIRIPMAAAPTAHTPAKRRSLSRTALISAAVTGKIDVRGAAPADAEAA